MAERTKPDLRVIEGGAKRHGPVDAKRWIVAVMSDPALSPHARVIAAYIGGLFNPTKGYAHPSIEQIVQDTGFGERTVYDATKAITDRGHFLVKSGHGAGRGKGRANEYHLNFLTLRLAAGSNEHRPCGKDPLTLREEAHRPCGPPHPNRKYSNGKDTTSPSAPGEQAPPARRSLRPALRDGSDTRARAREGAPAAQGDPVRDATPDGGRAGGAPPASLNGKDQQDSKADTSWNMWGWSSAPPPPLPKPTAEERAAMGEQTAAPRIPQPGDTTFSDDPTAVMLRDIAACNFDQWNDCVIPGLALPPIHPAAPPWSKHQTPEAVCAAWGAALAHADTITGDRALTMELFRVCGASSERTREILSKAKSPKYIRVALRNAKAKQAKWRAEQEELERAAAEQTQRDDDG